MSMLIHFLRSSDLEIYRQEMMDGCIWLKKNTHPSVSICQDDDNKALCSLQCVIVASSPWLSRSVTFSLSKVDGVSAWGVSSQLISVKRGGLVSCRSQPGSSPLNPSLHRQQRKASAGSPSLPDLIRRHPNVTQINHVKFIYFDHIFWLISPIRSKYQI